MIPALHGRIVRFLGTRLLFLSVGFVMLVTRLCAQTSEATKPELRFQHLSLDLNSSRIESIIQDRYGYIWIGTLGGLHRYDGVEVAIYLNSDDSTSLAGNRAGFLFEDSKGRLWIGTENGICHYNREKDSFVRYATVSTDSDPSAPRSNKISCVIEDPRKKIWVASERYGLLYLDQLTQKLIPYVFSHDSGLADAQVVSLCYGENLLWIGTAEDGLFALDLASGNVVHYAHDPKDKTSIGGTYIENILIDRNKNLWIATRENGLDRMDLKRDKNNFIHYRHQLDDMNSLTNNDVTTVYEDASGSIWICNENGGLHLYNSANNNFYRYVPDPADPSSISNISVKAFYQDKQGRFWVGSNLEGIDVADRYMFRFKHYYQSEDFQSINNNIVRNFLEDENGGLWIATDGGGLNYFDRKTNGFKFFKHDPRNTTTVSSNALLTLCEDKDGNIWVGTWRGGINIFDKKKLTFKTLQPDNHAITKVFYIMRDSRNNMWVATQSGGISIFNWQTRQFTNYMNDPSDPESLGGNDVVNILEDHEGKIWIATEFNGLNLYTKDQEGYVRFKRFTHDVSNLSSIASNGINDIFEDSKKNLWVATERGLSRLIKEGNYFENYQLKDGLESEHIKSIIEDDKGFLWLGTAAGISRFDPINKTFRNYSYNDGLQRGEFVRYSSYKTKSGELVFGGTNGFNIFHPDSIADNPFIPPVFITGLKIFNKPVKIGEEGSPLDRHISETETITLSYRQSVFSFDFVGLNFTHPHMNQYAFKMENFEDDWNYVGTQRTATYTSLDPGEYTFRVKASNNDGLWNEGGKSIRIIITPPIWQTTWFKISLALLATLILYFVIQYRVRHLNRANLALEEKVGERTAQLKTLVADLQSKQHEIEMANNELTKAHRQLENINSQLDKRVQERTVKLVKANQQLDRFVYSASHDLSAPLKSILGLINILKLDDNKNRGLLQHLDHMEKSVMKLETVIYHLTQFSRNMGGPVSSVTFTFKDVVEEVLEDLKYYSNAYNIHIIKDFNDDDQLMSDFMRMKIILTNLISNAIKYRDKNKEENYIKISLTHAEDSNIISVEDNGIGIEQEHQSKIFDMFFRATTKSEGSGLGLYIVKDVVEKLEGSIDVSCDQTITKFTIVLPAQPVVINK